MKTKIKLSAVAIIIMAFFIVGIKSSNALVPLIPNLQVKQPQFNPAVVKAVWCGNVQNKITERSETFSGSKEKNLNALNNLKNRLETLIVRLEGKGYDVTQLEADLANLKTKIDKLNDDYATYNQKLEEVKSYVCDKTNVEFKAKLTEARTALKQVRKDVQDAKNYWQTEIKADIKQLKSQKPTNQ